MPRSRVRSSLSAVCAIGLLAASQPTLSQSREATAGQPPSPGAVAIPGTPAGRQFAAWLDAFNSGDPAAMKAVLDRFVSGGPPVQVLQSIRQVSGGFDVVRINESTDSRLVALVKARGSEQFNIITTEVEAAADHRILSMPLTRTATPPEFAPAKLTDQALATALRMRLEELARTDTFSGAVLVLKNGKPIFSGAYGYADREARKPNRLDTIFRYGSMGKMFTATAVLQLVQSGKIKLSDPIGKFLPDYPNQEIRQKVTIEHLLTHTGGTGDIFTPEWAAHRTTIDSHADYVKLLGERGPLFEPGSRYAYSNYGYVLLGRIIEVASGEDYYAYVEDHIFKPAGMKSTGFWRESEQLAQRANGYMKTPGGLGSNRDTVPLRGMGAGGGLSTVDDLARFARALLDHRLLDAEHTALLTTGRIDPGSGGATKYAFGFEDAEAGTARHNFGHGGGAAGMNGQLRIFPEAGYVIVVLSNFDPPAAERVSNFVTTRLSI